MTSADEIKARVFAEFAQNCLVLAHFSINPYAANYGMEDADEVGLPPQRLADVSGAFIAGIATNPTELTGHDYDITSTGFLFQNPACVATVLFGKYLAKTDQNYYPAAFAAGYNKKENVIGTAKSIPEDQVQTMQITIEGGSTYVNKLLKELKWQKFQAIIRSH